MCCKENKIVMVERLCDIGASLTVTDKVISLTIIFGLIECM